MSSEITGLIQKAIDTLINNSEMRLEVKRLSLEKNALPISVEWTGDFFLTLSGEILWFDSDGMYWKNESDPKWQLHAIVQGSKKYEFLRALLPERPLSAIPCDQCKGVSYVTIGTVQCGCGKCLELGWLQSDGIGPWNAA